MTNLEKHLETALSSANKRAEKLEQAYDTETEMLVNAYRCGNIERFNSLLNKRFEQYCNKVSREVIKIGE